MYTKVAKRIPQESLLAFQHILKKNMHPCFVTYKNFFLCLGKVHPLTQTLWVIFEQMCQLSLAISPMSFNVPTCMSPIPLFPPFVPHGSLSLPFHSPFPSFPMSPNVLVSSPIIPFHPPPPYHFSIILPQCHLTSLGCPLNIPCSLPRHFPMIFYVS
jgi:hypothetical protein